MLRGYFVSKAHINKISTAMSMFSIIFTSPRVTVTSVVNMVDKNGLVGVAHISAMKDCNGVLVDVKDEEGR